MLSDELRRWTKRNLPRLNSQVSQGLLSPDKMVEIAQPHLTHLYQQLWTQAKIENLGVSEARRLIQLLGFIISSSEKHFQTQGYARGTGIKRLQYAEKLCGVLATIAGHPPRDTAYTYWIWNASAQALTFTDNPQELLFNQVVNRSDELFAKTCNQLRHMCYGDVQISSQKACEIISHAASNILEAKSQYVSLMAYADDTRSRRNLEPSFFMKEFRTYLATYPVNGKTWGGVSAANIASQMQLDYLLGTVDDNYTAHVMHRLGYLPKEYIRELKDDMMLPSIVDLILKQLNLTQVEVLRSDSADLKKSIQFHHSQLATTLQAYKQVIKAISSLTTFHWTLIKNYLTKPSLQMAKAEKESLNVNPDVGTGGMSMEDVKGVRDMRRQHPVITKLVACV